MTCCVSDALRGEVMPKANPCVVGSCALRDRDSPCYQLAPILPTANSIGESSKKCHGVRLETIQCISGPFHVSRHI